MILIGVATTAALFLSHTDVTTILCLQIAAVTAVAGAIVGVELNAKIAEWYTTKFANSQGMKRFELHMALLFGGGILSAVIGGTIAFVGSMQLLNHMLS